MKLFATAAIALVLPGLAMAQQSTANPVEQVQSPAFDPASLRQGMSGPPTRVMVLGTMHLANLTDFQPGLLEPVLDRLTVYRPDIIAIEAVSGVECDMFRRYPGRYEQTAKSYCPSTEVAYAETGFDVPAATALIDATLKDWPAQPSAQQRRDLAALFLAGGERTSALVQWLQLAPEEQIAADHLTPTLVEQLRRLAVRQNESELIAAVLAARLGLARVHPMDDHTADAVAMDYDEGVGPAVNEVWAQPNPTLVEMQAQSLDTPEDFLRTFRFNNLPSTQIGQARAEMGGALAHVSPQMSARKYVAWWEVRNLRMGANIRASFANRPGTKVLVLVGSSHKAYLDAYLSAISEVELIDPLSVL